MTAVLDIEVVVPYGNSTGALHLRFSKDYRTFCGLECDGWPVSDGSNLGTVIDSAYLCKRCRAAALK